MRRPHPPSTRRSRAARALAVCTAALLAVFAALTAGSPAATAAGSHRVVVYYQTQYDNGTYVSPKALTDNNTGVTDLMVGAFHINDNDVTLNDNTPDDPTFTQMWQDIGAMQSSGVHAIGMVGGAAQGSFQRLQSDFDTYYPRLRDVVSTYHLDGLDLDVEESVSLDSIEHLIDQLHTDFGSGFIVTLAPVATALSGGGNLSGFDYEQLYRDRADSISWFNAQFYCGWGSLADTSGYDAIVSRGVIPADKVVAGTLTNPANCGSGYVDIDTLKSTLGSLSATYDFGGVAGWEYFNSEPGGTAAPWQWASEVKSAMG
jgi:chitinase